MNMAFELTMPGVSSWNGRWSGEDSRHIIVRSGRTIEQINRMKDLDGQEFRYQWDDGWCAAVSCTVVDVATARRLRKLSAGFCGYDWMVDSIWHFGGICLRKDTVGMERII